MSEKRQRTDKVFKGSLTKFPERLRPDESESTAAEPVSVTDAVKRAIEQDDAQTVFFINFPPMMESEAHKFSIKNQDLIQSWQSWATANCEQKLQEKITQSMVSGDDTKEAMAARASYRAMVHDNLLRKAPWFVRLYDQNMSKKINVKIADLHTAILQAALEGFFLPYAVFSQLEKIFSSISDGIIKTGSPETVDGQQYWIMLTRYEYNELIGRVDPRIGVISFKITQTTAEYVSGKSSYKSADFDFEFGRYQCDFNSQVYGEVSKGFDPEIIESGKELTKSRSTHIALW